MAVVDERTVPLDDQPVIPPSYLGQLPAEHSYGAPATNLIGVHYPREIVRIERDYTSGELPQFTTLHPRELDGRV